MATIKIAQLYELMRKHEGVISVCHGERYFNVSARFVIGVFLIYEDDFIITLSCITSGEVVPLVGGIANHGNIRT